MTRAAPIGAIVGLYVDLVNPVGAGDIIETRSGRRYRVLSVREQVRGKHVGRQHLRAIVSEASAAPDEHVYAGLLGNARGGMIHRIRWYARGKGSARAGVKPRGRR